jgi:hypothetical protein
MRCEYMNIEIDCDGRCTGCNYFNYECSNCRGRFNLCYQETTNAEFTFRQRCPFCNKEVLKGL